MSSGRMDALNKALDLIHTPHALEVLSALSEDRSPYDVDGEPEAINKAVAFLRDLGVATTGPRPLEDSEHVTTITERGRALYRRLVEIETNARLDQIRPGSRLQLL